VVRSPSGTTTAPDLVAPLSLTPDDVYRKRAYVTDLSALEVGVMIVKDQSARGDSFRYSCCNVPSFQETCCSWLCRLLGVVLHGNCRKWWSTTWVTSTNWCKCWCSWLRRFSLSTLSLEFKKKGQRQRSRTDKQSVRYWVINQNKKGKRVLPLSWAQ
jgi:hypothetical protein